MKLCVLICVKCECIVSVLSCHCGVCVLCVGESETFPLMAACAGGHVNVLGWLLTHGTPLDELSREGQ